MTTCHHDLKLSPLRVRGTGFHTALQTLGGMRAQRVRRCVKCGCVSASGGIRRDPHLATPPAQHGSARDVLAWIDEQMPRGRWERAATLHEARLYGHRVLRRRGWLPPMVGGASRYFVGNGTNWSSTASWSATSGGASGATVPGSGDDVFLNASSPGNLTMDATTVEMHNLDCTGFTHTLTVSSVTTWTVYGTVLKLASGMTFSPNSNSTLGLNGNVLAVTWAGKAPPSSVWINSGASVSMQDAWTSTASSIVMNQATLTTNGNPISAWHIVPSGATASTMNLGASSITLADNSTPWTANTNWTVNAGTSTITLSANGSPTFAGAGLTYHNLTVNAQGTTSISGTNTFSGLTFAGTAVQTNALQLSNAQTITTSLTLTGNSTKNRISFHGVLFSATTITFSAGATVSATNVDYADLTFVGAPVQTISSVGDAGNNTGVTVTAAVAQSFLAGTGGFWSSLAWPVRIPLPQDDVTISGAYAAQTITLDMPRLCRNLDFTGTTGTLALAVPATFGVNFFGSVTLVAGISSVSLNNGWIMAARSNVTLSSAGKTFSGGNNLTVLMPITATLTLQDDVSIASNAYFLLQAGSVDANGHNVTAGLIFLGQFGLAWAVKMGSGTWTAAGNTTGAGTWSANANGTLTAQTSTLVLSDTTATAKTFTGGGYTYNNVTFSSGGTGTVTVVGSNTFNKLTIGAPKTVIFTAGTTTTANQVVATGSSGNIVTMNSTTAGTAWNLVVPGGIVSWDYVSLKDCHASGGAVFHAGSNSTNTSNNTGFIWDTWDGTPGYQHALCV